MIVPVGKILRWGLLGWAFLCGSLPAVFASGFMVREHSTAALGVGYAGVHAGAHDLADSFYNPAALAYHNSWKGHLNLNHLMFQSRFKLNTATNVLGQPIPGSQAGGNIAPAVSIPSMYATFPVQETDTVIGFSLNAPWGLTSENPEGWVGRYHALTSKMVSINACPMIARRVSNNVSLGIGMQIQQVQAELTNAVDFGLIGNLAGVAGATPGNQDGYVRVTGEDWGAGLVLGLIHEADENTRWGISYRSQVQHQLKGNARFRLDSAGIGQALSTTTGAFQDSWVTADLSTPTVVGVGLSHFPAPKWNLLFDVVRTFWSSFDELRLEFRNPLQADAVTMEEWKDTWFVSMGTTFQPNEYWTLRCGLAYDQGPVADDRRVPRIPTSSSRWLTFGSGYQAAENVTIEFGYSHLWYDDALINLSTASAGNAALGNLKGRFDTDLDIIGLSVQVGY